MLATRVGELASTIRRDGFFFGGERLYSDTRLGFSYCRLSCLINSMAGGGGGWGLFLGLGALTGRCTSEAGASSSKMLGMSDRSLSSESSKEILWRLRLGAVFFLSDRFLEANR